MKDGNTPIFLLSVRKTVRTGTLCVTWKSPHFNLKKENLMFSKYFEGKTMIKEINERNFLKTSNFRKTVKH